MVLKTILLTFVFSLCYLLIGCDEMVLEYESVGNFQIDEMIENGTHYIIVTGLSLHSSLNVKKVETLKNNSDIVVLVYLTLVRSKESPSGSFYYKFKIDDSVKQILFGKNKKLVWKNM